MAQSSKDTLKLGLLYPLSNHRLGAARAAAALLATDKINFNAAGSDFPKIELEMLPALRDTQHSAAHVLTALHDGEFETMDCVVGPSSSHVCVSAQNTLSVFNIPQVSYACTASSLSNTGLYPSFFRVVPPDSRQGNVMVRWMRHRLKVKEISVLYSDSDYGVGIFRDVSAAAAAASIKIVSAASYSYQAQGLDDANVRTLLLKIRDSGSKSIVLAGSAVDLVLLIAHGLGMLSKEYIWMTGDSGVNLEMYKSRKFFPVGVFATFPYNGEGTAQFNDFLDLWHGAAEEKLFSKYNATIFNATGGAAGLNPNVFLDSPNSKSSFSFDAVFSCALAKQAMLRNSSIATMVDAFQFVAFPGASGFVSFDSRGDREMPFSILNFHNGTLVEVARWLPSGNTDCGNFTAEEGFCITGEQIVFGGGALEPPQFGHDSFFADAAIIVASTAGLVLCIFVLVLILRVIKEKRENLLAQRHAAVSSAANRELKSFVQYVLHQVRLPFSAIHLALDAAKDEVGTLRRTESDLPPSEAETKLEQLLGTAADSTIGLGQVLEDALRFEKADDGRLLVELSPNILRSVLEKALKFSNVIFQQRQQRVRLVMHPSLEKMPPQLLMDGIKIGQVLSNLLSNASKHSKIGGKIVVKAKLKKIIQLREAVLVDGEGLRSALGENLRSLPPTTLPLTFEGSAMWLRRSELRHSQPVSVFDRLCAKPDRSDDPSPYLITRKCVISIAVRDFGSGLDESVRGKLFQPYTHDSKSSQLATHGLGLFVSRGIVEAHGGTMKAASRAPGSLFSFTIPYLVPSLLFDYSAPIADSFDWSTIRQGTTLLVVDDNMFILKIVRLKLEHYGLTVHVAPNGRTCIDMLFGVGNLAEKIDCLVVDKRMPGMNGVQLMEEVRSRGFRRLCCAFTADTLFEGTVNELRNAGADCVLSKGDLEGLGKALAGACPREEEEAVSATAERDVIVVVPG